MFYFLQSEEVDNESEDGSESDNKNGGEESESDNDDDEGDELLVKKTTFIENDKDFVEHNDCKDSEKFESTKTKKAIFEDADTSDEEV